MLGDWGTRDGLASPIGKNGCRAASEDRKALMLYCRDFENLADVRLLKPVSANTFTGHSGPTLTSQVFHPCTVGMVLADPADAETDQTFGVHQAANADWWCR
jgi:hypothetical protein